MVVIAYACSPRSCHCSFVPRQNKSINQRLISKRNIQSDDTKTQSLANPLKTIQKN